MFHLNPQFHSNPREDDRCVSLRDAARRPVAISAHLRRDLGLDQPAAPNGADAAPMRWRIAFRWPVYLRPVSQ